MSIVPWVCQKHGTMQELMLRTITSVLAECRVLGYSKGMLLDTKVVVQYRIGGKLISALGRVTIGVMFDEKTRI